MALLVGRSRGVRCLVVPADNEEFDGYNHSSRYKNQNDDDNKNEAPKRQTAAASAFLLVLGCGSSGRVFTLSTLASSRSAEAVAIERRQRPRQNRVAYTLADACTASCLSWRWKRCKHVRETGPMLVIVILVYAGR